MEYIDAYIPRDKDGQAGLLEQLRRLADLATSQATAEAYRRSYGSVKLRVELGANRHFGDSK